MYTAAIHHRRSEAERVDPFLAWARTDEAFFAAGACHILAYLFMQLHPNEGYSQIAIRPVRGFPGSHMYVTDGTWAFDYAGWTLEEDLWRISAQACEELFPGWAADRIHITDDLETFCAANNHRPPAHFPHLPWERAYQHIKKFPASPPSLT